MPLSPSSKMLSLFPGDRADPTLPAILEFQMPSTTVTTAPVPRSARGMVWIIGSMFAAILVAMGLIEVDRVVTAQGRVISQAATLVVQPLDASIVRSIDVHEGEHVKAGQVLAQLDPTFAAADVDALSAQVSSLQAQVSRLQAEVDDRVFTYSGTDANLLLQAAIFGQRQAEYSFKLENYTQKINSLVAAIARPTPMPRAIAVGWRWLPMSKRCGAISNGSRLAASSTPCPRSTRAQKWNATCAQQRRPSPVASATSRH